MGHFLQRSKSVVETTTSYDPKTSANTKIIFSTLVFSLTLIVSILIYTLYLPYIMILNCLGRMAKAHPHRSPSKTFPILSSKYFQIFSKYFPNTLH